MQAHITVSVTTKPELVQISTAYRQQVEGSPVLARNKYIAIREDKPKDKEQAKMPEFKTCKFVTEAIVADGEGQGTVHKVCANPDCPVHHAKQKQQQANAADNAKWKAEREKQRREHAISEACGARVLAAIGAAVPVRLLKRDLLFVVERMLPLLDKNRLAILARQHGIKKAKDNDSIAKLFAAFLRRAEESLIGRVAVQVSVLLAVSRTNGASALKDAAAVYKVDTDAIVAKVKQEFAAKANAAKKPSVKAPTKAKKAA